MGCPLIEVMKMLQEKSEQLQAWFGLSYSSFLVLPRVAMESMPKEWQDKMAALLHEYSDTINTSAFGVGGCTVRATDESGRLIRMPDKLLNYRHPKESTIRDLKS